MSSLTERFPDLLPMEHIRVDGEEHTFKVIEYEDGTTSTKRDYAPDKAPVLEIESVTGTVNGRTVTFEQGVDYTVVDSDGDGRDDTIEFTQSGEQPDDNTRFTITYLARSVLVRYVEAYQDEFERVGDDILSVIDSRYVTEASESGLVDDFEDGDLTEYSVTTGSGTQATVQNNVVEAGSAALELQPESGQDVVAQSVRGLPRYPQRGDSFEFYVQLASAADTVSFDFFYDADTGDHYRITVSAPDDSFTLEKENGRKSNTDQADIQSHIGEWLRIEVDVEPVGPIDARIFTPNNVLLSDVRISDTEYVDGGIRLSGTTTNANSSVYIDTIDITRRDSADLDRIGAIFGELGRRRGRADDEYASFLRSVVQSFSGRGTVSGIRFAVASGLGADPESIEIIEDFKNNSYIIGIEQPFPPHNLVTLTDLGELADPSGVNFARVKYDIVTEEISADDGFNVQTGIAQQDQLTSDDAAFVNPNTRSVAETLAANDLAATNPNLTIVSEETAADDTPFVNQNLRVVTDEMQAADADTTTIRTVEWETSNWDEMYWAVEHN